VLCVSGGKERKGTWVRERTSFVRFCQRSRESCGKRHGRCDGGVSRRETLSGQPSPG
jgi:hypothetical protein